MKIAFKLATTAALVAGIPALWGSSTTSASPRAEAPAPIVAAPTHPSFGEAEDTELQNAKSCNARFGNEYVCATYIEQRGTETREAKACVKLAQCNRDRELPRSCRIVLDGDGSCSDVPKRDLDSSP
jgi:hypothetical protein